MSNGPLRRWSFLMELPVKMIRSLLWMLAKPCWLCNLISTSRVETHCFITSLGNGMLGQSLLRLWSRDGCWKCQKVIILFSCFHRLIMMKVWVILSAWNLLRHANNGDLWTIAFSMLTFTINELKFDSCLMQLSA